MKFLVLCLLVLIVLFCCSTESGKTKKNKKKKSLTVRWLYAAVDVKPNPRFTDSQVQGTIQFRQKIVGKRAGTTEYRVNLIGFNSTDDILRHGSHIHTFGTITTGCEGAGPHYNPTNKSHALPNQKPREMGDLSNLEEDGEGNCEMSFMNKMVELRGSYSILGRTWDVHAQEDTGTGRSGHAGPRIACGVVVASDGSAWQNN